MTANTGFSRRDFLKWGGAGVAGATLFGVAGCGGGQESGEQQGGGGLVERGSIRIEMPTHMIPPDPNTSKWMGTRSRSTSPARSGSTARTDDRLLDEPPGSQVEPHRVPGLEQLIDRFGVGGHSSLTLQQLRGLRRRA